MRDEGFVRGVDVRASRTEGGFTLVELLIGMLITLIGLVGLMGLYRSNSRANVDSDRTSQASIIGQRTMEELRGLSVEEIATRAGTAGYPIENNPLAFLPPLPDNTRGVTYTRCLDAEALAIDNDLIRFRVEVRWRDDRRAVDCDVAEPEHMIAYETVRNRTDGL